jgi:predicted DNA-binding transcriptional regulator YafY
VATPATRLLAALDLLQARPRITAARLAERLGVDARSARRYISRLRDLGIPIEADRGPYGGYRLLPGFKLPPLMLSDDEALAVTLGLLAARELGLSGALPAVEGALGKIERVLPVTLRERVSAVRQTVALDIGAGGPPADATDPASAHLASGPPDATTRWLPVLGLAARQGQRVRMRYQSRASGQTDRALDPYGLVYHGGRWYAVGYCHLRHAARVFRLDRVLLAEPCDERFERPPDFDGLAFALQSFAAIPDHWLVEVELDTSLEQVRWSVPPAFATLEESPVGVVLRAYDHDLDHAARFLAGLGCSLRVRRPPELLAALRRLATRLAAAASGIESADLRSTLAR